MPSVTLENVQNFAEKITQKINDDKVKVSCPELGNTYARLVITSPGSTSAYGFIALATGDIFKSASWKAPAKGVRGNMFADNALACCTDYGIVYWQSGRKKST